MVFFKKYIYFIYLMLKAVNMMHSILFPFVH